MVDAHYERITTGKVYDISGGTLKPKNAQYNLTTHQFEVTLNRSCTIDEIDEPAGAEAIPRYNFQFTPIHQLEHVPDEQKVDVLAVVTDCTEPNTFTSKAGKEMTKRVMQLADASNRGIAASTSSNSLTSLLAVRMLESGSQLASSTRRSSRTAPSLPFCCA